jgi:hypothetical protein
MRFGVLIGVIATLAVAQATHTCGFVRGALALTSSAPAPSGACGGWASSTFADGCAGAPPASAYTIQHPDFFSGYARQSGQTYVSTGGCKGNANCHPPWAVAGVDYPVGVSTVGTGFASPGSATDPTNSSSPNYSNGNPAHCARPGNANVIVCNGVTKQEVDIGPFDFSYQGNATGHGMGLTISPNVQGPCIIHDSYFVFDLNSTSHTTGAAAYSFQGCSSLTIKNSVFRLRNDTTGVMDAMWAPPGSTNLFYFAGAGTRLGNVNNKLNLEYDAFIHCPSRCFSTSALNASHNYFEGVNIYDSTGFAAHGDGWMAVFYNGPTGFASVQICNCSGIDSFVEKFDTWLAPNFGAGATSCFTCALVNVPGGVLHGTSTAGSNILHVTQVGMSGGQYPAVGANVFGTPRDNAYVFPHAAPNTVPAVLQCADSQGNPGCSLAQAQSCSTATPCDYTLTVPWSVTCPNDRVSNCSWGYIFAADVNTADYENNVWVGNIITATRAAPGFCTGFPCPAVQSAWWAGYGRYQNVIVKNNYADLCGIGGSFFQSQEMRGSPRYTTGPPDYHCNVPLYPSTQLDPNLQNFGGAAPETSAVEGGNVMMTNGAYFIVFKAPQNSVRRPSPKGPPASLLPAPTRPQGPGPQPRRL